MSVLLASGSPQRRAIFEQLRVRFRVVVPDVRELSQGDPDGVAQANARAKVEAAIPAAVDDELIVGVDTVVVVDGGVHGKPEDRDDAREMLLMLRKREHVVASGLSLCRDGALFDRIAHTTVRFRDFDDASLERYLDSGEWRERAGGYAIQGSGAALVERVDGDFYNVVGFPVASFLDLVDELALAPRIYA